MTDLASIRSLRRLRDISPSTFRAIVLVYCGTLTTIQGSVAVALTGLRGWGIGYVFLALTGLTFLLQGVWQLRNHKASPSSTYGWIEYTLAGFAGLLTITFTGFLLLLP